MDGWTIAWLVWIAAFGAIEGLAFLSHRAGATLSEHVWSWFRINRGWGDWRIAVPRFLLLVFLAWLFLHLGFGWLTT